MAAVTAPFPQRGDTSEVEHPDHVALIAGAIDPAEGGRWADLGAGAGAFTLALADLLGPAADLIAVDLDGGALAWLDAELRRRFPSARLQTLRQDFRDPLPIGAGALDGVLAANSLHFLADRGSVLAAVRRLLRPGGRLVVVEYDADRGNPWVPHPFSFPRWQVEAAAAGFDVPRLVGRVPSRFLGAIYAAVCTSPGADRGRAADGTPVRHGTMPPHGDDREE